MQPDGQGAGADAEPDLWLPPPPLNALLENLVAVEAVTLPRRLPAPFGLSLIALARGADRERSPGEHARRGHDARVRGASVSRADAAADALATLGRPRCTAHLRGFGPGAALERAARRARLLRAGHAALLLPARSLDRRPASSRPLPTLDTRHLHRLSDLRRRRARPALPAAGAAPVEPADRAGHGLAARAPPRARRGVHVHLPENAAGRPPGGHRRRSGVRLRQLPHRPDAPRERGPVGGLVAAGAGGDGARLHGDQPAPTARLAGAGGPGVRAISPRPAHPAGADGGAGDRRATRSSASSSGRGRGCPRSGRVASGSVGGC